MADGQTLGTLPIVMPLVPGQYMIFAGRRWRIVDVDDRRKVAELVSAPGGRAPPFFGGSGALVHDCVREKMRSMLVSDETPRYLDATARGLLLDARAAYRELGLDRRAIVEHADTTILFHWAGDRVANTLMLAFIRAGLEVSVDGAVLSILDTSPAGVRAALKEMAGDTQLQACELAAAARNKEREKHHRYLDEELLTLDYAASELDLGGARRCVTELLVGG